MDDAENKEGGTGKVSLVEIKDSIIELKFLAPGENAEEHDAMAEETRVLYEELCTKRPDDSFKVLVDLTNAGMPTNHARDIYVRTLSEKNITKAAIFGLGKAISAVVSFIVSASGKSKDRVQFFAGKDDALRWLSQ